jgi:hypothetical protein
MILGLRCTKQIQALNMMKILAPTLRQPAPRAVQLESVMLEVLSKTPYFPDKNLSNRFLAGKEQSIG